MEGGEGAESWVATTVMLERASKLAACSLPSTLEIRAMKTGSTGFRTELQRRIFEDFGGRAAETTFGVNNRPFYMALSS